MDKRSHLKNKQLKRFKLQLNSNNNNKTKNTGSKKQKSKQIRNANDNEGEKQQDESPIMSDSNELEFEEDQDNQADTQELDKKLNVSNLQRFEMLLKKSTIPHSDKDNEDTKPEANSEASSEHLNEPNSSKTPGTDTKANKKSRNVPRAPQPFENFQNIESLLWKKEKQADSHGDSELKAERHANEKLTHENQKLIAIVKSCIRERDEMKHELAKQHKELVRAKQKFDSVSTEYMQIMSERDIVHKEIEALQEKLSKYQEDKLRNETYDAANKLKLYENKFLHMNSAPNGNSLNEKFDSVEMIDALRSQLAAVTKQRDDALSQVRNKHKSKLSAIVQFSLTSLTT